MKLYKDYFEQIKEHPETAPVFWEAFMRYSKYHVPQIRDTLRRTVDDAVQLKDLDTHVDNIIVHTSAIVARKWNPEKSSFRYFAQYKLQYELKTYARCLRQQKYKTDCQSIEALEARENREYVSYTPITPNNESYYDLVFDLEELLPLIPERARPIFELRIKGYSVKDICDELHKTDNSVRYLLRIALESFPYPHEKLIVGE